MKYVYYEYYSLPSDGLESLSTIRILFRSVQYHWYRYSSTYHIQVQIHKCPIYSSVRYWFIIEYLNQFTSVFIILSFPLLIGFNLLLMILFFYPITYLDAFFSRNRFKFIIYYCYDIYCYLLMFLSLNCIFLSLNYSLLIFS